MKKKNFTLRLDEEIIKSAKMRAILEGTNVSAVIEEFLMNYAKSIEVTRNKKA